MPAMEPPEGSISSPNTVNDSERVEYVKYVLQFHREDPVTSVKRTVSPPADTSPIIQALNNKIKNPEKNTENYQKLLQDTEAIFYILPDTKAALILLIDPEVAPAFEREFSFTNTESQVTMTASSLDALPSKCAVVEYRTSPVEPDQWLGLRRRKIQPPIISAFLKETKGIFLEWSLEHEGSTGQVTGQVRIKFSALMPKGTALFPIYLLEEGYEVAPTNKPARSCTYCKQIGHNRQTCISAPACRFCSKTDHPAFMCQTNPARRARADHWKKKQAKTAAETAAKTAAQAAPVPSTPHTPLIFKTVGLPGSNEAQMAAAAAKTKPRPTMARSPKKPTPTRTSLDVAFPSIAEDTTDEDVPKHANSEDESSSEDEHRNRKGIQTTAGPHRVAQDAMTDINPVVQTEVSSQNPTTEDLERVMIEDDSISVRTQIFQAQAAPEAETIDGDLVMSEQDQAVEPVTDPSTSTTN